MSASDPIWDVLIIGAGMSGLSARRTFVEKGLSCLTLEKSRGLGGRVSTRRMDGICADLGAQFTSAKGRHWQGLIDSSRAEGLKPIFLNTDSQYPRYIHSQGMSCLARILVLDPENLSAPIKRETTVSRIEFAASGVFWEVVDQTNQRYRARALMVTLPVPQALELLKGFELVSKLGFDESQLRRLDGLSYSRCLSAAYILNEETSLDPPGILKNPSAEISGIFEQRKKGLNTSEPTVVVQAAAALSLELWENPSETLLEILWKKASAATQGSLLPKEYKLAWMQKWKYCEPLQHLHTNFEKVLTHVAAPLVLAGDAFGGSKIEGAIVSGREAALEIINALTGVE